MDYGIGNWMRRRSQLSNRNIAISTRNEAISYQSLNLRTDRLANSLASTGVRLGDRVALLLENSPEWIELFFAIAKLGGIVVPIDSTLTPDEVSFILTDSRPRIAFTSNIYSDILQKALKETSMELDLVVEAHAENGPFANYDDYAHSGSADFPPQQISGSEILMISYTTGPALRPKGAIITHANITSHTVSMITSRLGLTGVDETLAIEPFTNVFGLGTLALPLLYLGGTVHIDRRLKPTDYIDALNRTDPSIISLSFHTWSEVTDHMKQQSLNLPSLRHALCTEGQLSPATSKLMRSQGIEVANTYGLVELCGVGTLEEPTDSFAQTVHRGKPLLDIEIKAIDPNGAPLSGELTGELVFKGPSVFKGYWNLPAETSQALKDGALHSGETGCLDREGNLYVSGTSDSWSQINNRFSFKEIEMALATQKEISEIAAVGVTGDGQDKAVLVAVVLKPQFDLTAAEITQRLKKLWPSNTHSTRVIVLDQLPRSASGKILKSEIEKIYLNQGKIS